MDTSQVANFLFLVIIVVRMGINTTTSIRSSVTSAIVRLSPREPPFKVSDEKIFFDVVRALFQHRRQRVRNALCHSFDEVFPDVKLRKSQKKELLDRKLPEELVDVRVIDLAPEKFGKIADHLIVNK